MYQLWISFILPSPQQHFHLAQSYGPNVPSCCTVGPASSIKCCFWHYRWGDKVKDIIRGAGKPSERDEKDRVFAVADLPLRYSPSLVEYASISSVARAFLYMLVKGKVLFRLTRRSKESSRFKLEFPFKFEHLTGRFSSSGKLLAF